MKFLTDAGVFSKKMIDFGSQVLFILFVLPARRDGFDVGWWYGPLALLWLRPKGVHATMVDVNTRALDLAQKNADLNQVEAKIFQSNVYDQVEGSFDHIISNPSHSGWEKVVHQVLSEVLDHLESWWRLNHCQEPPEGAKAKMEEVFGNCEILQKKDKGYYIFKE